MMSFSTHFKSASITERVEQIIEDLQPPQGVIEQPPPGKVNQTELEYRLAWARTYLKKYGLITNSTRGVRAPTPEGVAAEEVDPRVVVRFVHEQSRRERQGRTKSAGADEGQTEPETGGEETASCVKR